MGAFVPYKHLYVHVPFCARRCSYCDFSIAVRRVVPEREFANAIRQELRTRHHRPLVLDTVYLGGGTPSRLGSDGIARLMDTVRSAATVQGDAEVTLEANPEDISLAAIRAWQAYGINRLSIGVQSFDNRVLQWMHRVHDAESAARAVQTVRDAGFTAFSLDLIFALPAQLERDWQRDVAQTLALEPEHISLYGLTIEPRTPLGKWQARGETVAGSEESYESEFLLAHAQLSSAGFEHYEVSNFGRPGKRAVHNSAYWRGVPYLGVGPSAHGFDGDERRWNIEAYSAWYAAATSGADPKQGSEVLTELNRITEGVYLGLRTVEGVVLTESEASTLSSWFDAGWLEWTGEGAMRRARCSAMGWLRLDRLASDLTALRSHS